MKGRKNIIQDPAKGPRGATTTGPDATTPPPPLSDKTWWGGGGGMSPGGIGGTGGGGGLLPWCVTGLYKGSRTRTKQIVPPSTKHAKKFGAVGTMAPAPLSFKARRGGGGVSAYKDRARLPPRAKDAPEGSHCRTL